VSGNEPDSSEIEETIQVNICLKTGHGNVGCFQKAKVPVNKLLILAFSVITWLRKCVKATSS